MSYIANRFRDLCRRHPGTRKTGALRDRAGTYCIEMSRPNGRQFYFCAMVRTNSPVIAIRDQVFVQAQAAKREIILGIGYDFYRFDPAEIAKMALSREVVRGVTVTKFDMSIGKRLAPEMNPLLANKKLTRSERSTRRALVHHFAVVQEGVS